MSTRAPLRLAVFVLLAGCTAEPPTVDEHLDQDRLAELFGEADEIAEDPGKADDPGCNGVIVPDSGPFDRVVALTFDDGPNPATTPQILAELRRRNIPAAFFINGTRVSSAASQEIVDEIVADPLFILANHSWSHSDDPFLDQRTPEGLAAEIDDVTEIISEAGETNRFFRFPFGRAKCHTAEAVRSRGYAITGWHVDSADWCFSARPAGNCSWSGVPAAYRTGGLLEFTMDQVRRRSGGVVLFHDIHQYTADQLPAFLDMLEAEGYRFAALTDTEMLPRLNGITPPPPNFVGSPCEGDADCGFLDSAFCHDAGFCTVTCEGTCPDRIGAAPTFCIADGDGGVCASRSVMANDYCADLPGTVSGPRDRYLGSSGASARTATVCAPAL